MTIGEYFEVVIKKELGEIVINQPYLSAILTSVMIEKLGSFHYKQNNSSKKFYTAINAYKAFGAYKDLCSKKSAFDIYSGLRCNMVHAGVPGKAIVLTKGDGKHLDILHNGAILIVNVENYYNDMVSAWNELFDKNQELKDTAILTFESTTS